MKNKNKIFLALVIFLALSLGLNYNEALAQNCTYGIDSECGPGKVCSTEGDCIDGDTDAGRTKCEGTGESTCGPGKICYNKYCTASTTSDATTGATVPTEFVNPITTTTLEGLLTNLLKALQGVVALIAIIMIVIGGMMYMFSGVDEKMVENAKKAIGGAVIGLAIVFAAPAFLKEILKIVGGPTSSGLLANAPSIKDIAERVLNLLLSIVGILGIIGLIIGGGFYLTSYGDEERIKKGKDIIAASLFGIIIAMAALVIVKQIAALFGQ